jgi:WD40 repeat protein
MKPARRLTGHAMQKPINDATLAADGHTFAFVDDDGLMVGDVSAPERAQRVPLDDGAGAVEARSSGLSVVIDFTNGTKELWSVAGGERHRLYAGKFKFASPSPSGDRVVTVEGSRVIVRNAATGAELSAVEHPATRMLHAVRWSPSAELYAVAYTDRPGGESLRSLEVWATTGAAPLWSLHTQRLAQAYVPVVFAWSARGTLLYALTDEPGEGNGSAVWELAAPEAKPRCVATIEGQFLRALGQGAGGELLTVRESVRQRVQLADISPTGALENPRALTQSELDERPTGWASARTVLLMSLRDLVPHLARHDVGASDSRWIEGKGWAQTWPTATGREDELLYWWTAAKGAPWQLSLKRGTSERELQLPGPVSGTVSTISAPPHVQRVRCAAQACVLSVPGAFYDLDLAGGPPSLRFHRAEPVRLWAVSPDGERVAVVGAEPVVFVLDRFGAELMRHTVPELEDLRGLAFGPGGDLYVSGMGADGLQRVGRLTATGVLEVLQSSPSAYAELQPSPDGKKLAYLEKEFDSDLWFTP